MCCLGWGSCLDMSEESSLGGTGGGDSAKNTLSLEHLELTYGSYNTL